MSHEDTKISCLRGFVSRRSWERYNRPMDDDTRKALAAIDEAVAWVREQQAAEPAPLSERYLRHIAQVEAMPRNRSGADKSGLWEGFARDLEHFKKARRIR